MNGMRKLLGVLLAILMLCMPLSLLAACAPDNPDTPKPSVDYEFVFEGGGLFSDGVTYHVSIYGNKDANQSFTLHVDEMPILTLTGNWVLEQGKGYKLYFNDTNKSFAYSRFNEDTKEFTLKYNLNLGGGQGMSKVVLTCKDEAFAEEYDGVGLPPLPPTFSGHGWNKTNKYDCVLYCYEDGTCLSVTNRTGVPNRSGTYTYDAEKNQYSFEFEDERDNYLPDYFEKDELGRDVPRYDYCVFMGDDPTLGPDKLGYRRNLPYEDGFPRFNTGAYYYTDDGEKHEYDFVTTYDEETKTYTLYYEAFAKVLMHRVVTYTVDD